MATEADCCAYKRDQDLANLLAFALCARQRDRDALADSSMCSLKIPGGTFASWRSRIPREASHERHRVSPFTSGSRIHMKMMRRNLAPGRLGQLYGIWTTRSGDQVLFDRRYHPRWRRTPDGNVTPEDPTTWIENIAGERSAVQTNAHQSLFGER